MLKSIGKQVVIVKNPKSKIFEEAIFVIKDGINHSENDILQECEKIINEQSLRFNKRKNKTAIIASLISGLVIISIMVIMYIFML